jgi:Carboxypeptidase regulatory-like domain
VTLEPGEWRKVELRLTQPARTLKGRVRDAAGRPVADARVLIGKDPDDLGSRCTGFFPINGPTGADGRFLLAGLFEGKVHLAVNKNGYVPLVRKDLELPPEDVDLDLVLETGFTVTVKVVGADGQPVKDLSLSVTAPGYPAWCQDNKAPGVYAFTDLPKDSTATIWFQWAAKTFTRSVLVKSDLTETFTMPAAGKILVDFGAIEGEAFLLELRAPDVKEDQRPNWIFDAPAAGSPRTFLAKPVLPGEWEAVLLDGNQVAQAEPVTVRPGETSRVVFKKP